MPAKIFYTLIGGFAGGVFVSSLLPATFFTGFFLLFLGAILFLWFQFNRLDFKSLLLLPLVMAAFGAGIFRYELSRNSGLEPVLQEKISETVTVKGVVIGEPDRREGSTRLKVRVENLLADRNEFLINTGVLVIAERYSDFEYGDKIEVVGRITKPENFEGDNGRVFNYPAYLAKDGIYYEFYKPAIEVLEKDAGNPIKAALLDFKNSFVENMEAVIPKPEVSLLGGILLGAKRSLGDKLLDDFRLVGVIHIVVLSGYNITIVAEAVRRFFGFLPRREGLLFAGISIILFTIMIGASAATIRAAIMAVLVVVARYLSRTYGITRALALAGFVMVAINPQVLVFDPSFQLSFLATIGLIYVSPVVSKFLVPSGFYRPLKEAAIATMSTQIFVLPFLVYQIGEVSLVSLPANLLILATIPMTMLFGFLTGLAGFVWNFLALPFGFISFALLYYELAVVNLFSKIPFASVSAPALPFGAIVAWYLLYFFLLKKFYQSSFAGLSAPRGRS